MNKTVLITGASSGVGAAAARQFAGKGYQVILVGRNEARLSSIADEIGPTATWIVCDASVGTSVEAMAQKVLSETGEPDVIIH